MQENTLSNDLPFDDGFMYASEDEKSLGIQTKTYDNGSIVKKVKLPHSKRDALVRMLKAKESVEVSRNMDKDPEKYQMAVITASTTLDGKKAIIEEVKELSFKDYQILMLMNNELNF